MKSVGKWIITIIMPIIGIITPICWDLFKEDCKELTIQLERKIDILSTFGDKFDIYTKDSLKLREYCFYEYSIINTGNQTIVGYGANSDILTADNGLRIAPDSIIVNLYSNGGIDAALEHNHIYFKQIRPGEKISLLCATNDKIDSSVLLINDRDVKDGNIKYITYEDKLTTFEKTSINYKWGQVIAYSVNLIFIIIFIIVSISDWIDKRRPIHIFLIILWFVCFIYTFSLPIRWLL